MSRAQAARRRRFLVAATGLLCAVAWWPVRGQSPAPASEVLVFAAASLQTALDGLAEPVRRATGVTMRVSFASTSTLAKQIESGAPAGLFLAADLDWMEYLSARRLIRP